MSGLVVALKQPLRLAALLLNAGLFVVGLYFETHPRDRHDVWSAGGVAAVAVVNSAALTLGRPRAGSRPLWRRLRRIAFIANALLVAAAVVIVGVEALRDAHHALIYGVVLLLPPLLTVAALQREAPG